MGLRQAIIVATTSFLLGALSTHWMADSLTLWKSPLTEQHIRTAVDYYVVLTAPRAFPLPVLSVLWAVIALAVAALGASALRGEAENVMFDGASIFLFLMAGYVYLTDVIPDLNLLASNHAVLRKSVDVPAMFVKPTVDIASRHLVCCVLLTGILVLQGGRLWAEGEQEAEDAEIASQQAAEDEKSHSPSRDSPEIARRRHHDPQPEPEEHVPNGTHSSMRKKPSARRSARKAATERSS